MKQNLLSPNFIAEAVSCLVSKNKLWENKKVVISVIANIAPQQTHDICAKYFEGDVQGSMQMQLEAIELIDALFCEVNPIPVKKALNLMGFEAGTLRLPLTEMEEANAAKLEKAMKDYGLL